MNKKVLVISYSQTGQLTNLVNRFISPLKSDESVEVYHKTIVPKKAYPFPWDVMTFMDTFPESIYMDPCEIEEFEEDENDYDLVILAYQVWFLSPSVPTTAFLKSSWAKKKLKDKPVITLIGCRNMWVMAQEKMKGLLKGIGANLIDNVVLIDRGKSYETFVTTPVWMLTGKRKLSFFSEAGICPNEIKKSTRFGKAIVEALKENKEKKNKSLLQGLKAVEVNIKLIKSEKIATKSFTIWGGLIRKLGKPGNPKRKPVVMLYLVFLLLIILTIVPISMLIQSILRRVNKEAIQKEKEFYELPSGNGEEKMKDFL